jgi:hypothetical protein
VTLETSSVVFVFFIKTGICNLQNLLVYNVAQRSPSLVGQYAFYVEESYFLFFAGMVSECLFIEELFFGR